MEVPAPPVVEADADLKDAVIETADGRGGVAPEELERLVLLEELAGVELLDPAAQLRRRGLGAAGSRGLVRCPFGWSLWRAGRLAVA